MKQFSLPSLSFKKTGCCDLKQEDIYFRISSTPFNSTLYFFIFFFRQENSLSIRSEKTEKRKSVNMFYFTYKKSWLNEDKTKLLKNLILLIGQSWKKQTGKVWREFDEFWEIECSRNCASRFPLVIKMRKLDKLGST